MNDWRKQFSPSTWDMGVVKSTDVYEGPLI